VNAPSLRPLRIGEILDVSIKLYLRNWRTLVPLVLVVAAPLHLLGLVVTLSTMPEGSRVTFGDLTGGTPSATPAEEAAPDASFWTGQAIVLVLAILVTTLATAACFKALADAYLGRSCPWRSSMRFALKRLHSILWLTVMTFFLMMLGFLALVIPGIYLFIAWAVATPVLLLEDRRGFKALSRSHDLVKGRWWPTCGAIIVGFLLSSIVSTVVQGLIIAPAFAADDSSTAAVVANAVATVVGLLIATPFQAAIVAVVYFDLRVRKEAFDLQLLGERLGLTPADAGEIPAPVGPAPTGPAPPADGTEAGPKRPPYWPPPPGWQPD
jgi:Membrane domain of glycerophosphoryl diester phosphodiesterase